MPDGTAIDYVLDGNHRRIGKKLNGTLVSAYLYRNDLNIVAELDGTGALVSQFVYGTQPHVPDFLLRGGKAYRIVSDERGSVRLVVDTSTGAIAQRLDYDAWGSVTSDTSPGFQPFGFAGGLYDRDTGFVRFGARDYEPSVGRWLGKDPILFWGGQANLDLYAGGDPVNRVDPSGELAPLLVGAVVVGAALAGGFAEAGFKPNGTAGDFAFGAATGIVGAVGALSGSWVLGGVVVGANLIYNTQGGKDLGGVWDTVASCAGDFLCQELTGPAAPVACELASETMENMSQDIRQSDVPAGKSNR